MSPPLLSDEGEDFSSNDSLLRFVSGPAPDTQCIAIDIVDDMDFEENHSFSVSIMNIKPSIAFAGLPTSVVIQDNNGQHLLPFQ